MELMKSVLPTVLLALTFTFAASAEAGTFAFGAQSGYKDNGVSRGMTAGGEFNNKRMQIAEIQERTRGNNSEAFEGRNANRRQYSSQSSTSGNN